ncbi:MAG: hypothetical protein JSR99_17000 [Proteobacteria bacterium]|nr:hypothetical protein [Pseudomonadota bacterium]
MFQFSDRTRGDFVFIDANLELHLIGIRAILERNRKSEADYSESIRRLEAAAKNAPHGEYGQHLIDRAVDAMHLGVYHDAANSMAAVGMLAPLIESLFVHLFRKFGDRITRSKTGRRARFSPGKYWDPRWYAATKDVKDRQDILLGIKQLAKEIGLDAFLPVSHQATVSALFAYRNNMFHNGFEWPTEKRNAFARKIIAEGWADWFSSATTGDEPWIFYMTEQFIAHCLEYIDELVLSAGRFHRKVEQDGI